MTFIDCTVQSDADQSVTPNYALERSVKGLSERAAGAQTIIAPAARRPASRGPLNADVRRHEESLCIGAA